MHVLAIEPYYGGSHRQFLQMLGQGRHRWSLVTRPARHWKWRMRSSPADILDDVATTIERAGLPDALLLSDMLDVPTWLGLLAADRRLDNALLEVPRILYFHENQWHYPKAPQSRVDHHFGFTNLLSAAAADVCVFNSHFNRSTFLEGSRQFLARMPDARTAIDLDAIEQRSRVIAPGFTAPEIPARADRLPHRLRLGWIGRFEHDKRPDRFCELLNRLTRRGVDFELILLGQRGRTVESLEQIRQQFASHLLHDGFAETRHAYETRLAQMDLVISTADHEFFGVAMCEAIWSGAIPVAPDGLAYREYLPDSLRFGGIDRAVDIIVAMQQTPDVSTLRDQLRNRIDEFRSDRVIETFDNLFDQYG